MTEKIFADGMRYEPPSDKAPDWVKGKISIKVEAFIKFLQAQENERGWINLDIKVSKGGNYYVELNTYKPGQANPATATPEKPPKTFAEQIAGDDDIPVINERYGKPSSN